jgi:hypothetical protein
VSPSVNSGAESAEASAERAAYPFWYLNTVCHSEQSEESKILRSFLLPQNDNCVGF